MKLTTYALAVSLLALPSLARAQSSDVATRRELIRRAQTESTAGHHREALELAERAAGIEMSTSLRVFLIDEQRATGHLAEALDNAEQCVREATSNTALPNRSAILAACREADAALGSQVGHVTVNIPTRPAGLHVTVAGSNVRDALLGVPYIVTPGTLEVRVEAPEHRPFSRTVTVAAGQTVEVAVALEELQHTAPTTPVASEAPSPAPPQLVTTTRRSYTGPIIVTGLGVVALAAALVINLAVADPAFSNLQHQYCQAPAYNNCLDVPDARSQQSNVATLDTASWVLVGVGGALVVGGLVWLAVSPSSRVVERVHPVASVGRDGTAIVGLGGSF